MAMGLYFVIIVIADADEVGSAFKAFEWFYLVPVLLLVVLNYFARAQRWHSYLVSIDLSMPRARSHGLFLAGLSMSITPAKVGEAMKALFLKEEKNAPIERGVAVVFAERVSDMIGMVALIGLGSFAMAYGQISFLCVVFALSFILIILAKEDYTEWLILRLKRRKLLSRLGYVVEVAARDARTLLTGRRLVESSALSVIAWSAECIAFYLILMGVSAEVGMLECVFIYSFSSVIGAISMMPGGMGTTEATMIGLLVLLSVAAPVASFSVILVRVCTLWFAVAVGIVFLILYARRSSKSSTLETSIQM